MKANSQVSLRDLPAGVPVMFPDADAIRRATPYNSQYVLENLRARGLFNKAMLIKAAWTTTGASCTFDALATPDTPQGYYSSYPTVTASVPVSTQFTVADDADAKRMWDCHPALIERLITYRQNVISGTDPEVFALGKDDTVIPSWEYLKHEKSDEVYCYPDGFQAEFRPSFIGGYSCHEQMVNGMWNAMETLMRTLRAHQPSAYISSIPVVPIPAPMMENAPRKWARLGCSPSRNAYGLRGAITGSGVDIPERWAGCHMHFGNLNACSEQMRVSAVKAMDAIAGVAFTSLFAGLESPSRRQFYGLAGEYRLPAHGLEWRVPSSRVLHHPAVTHLCFDLARASCLIGLAGVLDRVWKYDEEEVIHIINTLDVRKARALLRKNRSTLSTILNTIYNESRAAQRLALPFILKGIKSQMGANVYDNLILTWNLNDYYDDNVTRFMDYAREREDVDECEDNPEYDD